MSIKNVCSECEYFNPDPYKMEKLCCGKALDEKGKFKELVKYGKNSDKN